MKRSLAFWSAILLSALLVAGGFRMLGKPSSSNALLHCLPGLAVEGDRLLLQGKGGELPENLPPLLLELPALAPAAAIVDSLLPLLRRSEEFVLAVEAEGPTHYAVLRLDEDSLQALQGGRLPLSWVEPGFALRDGGRGSSFVLEGPWAKSLQGRFESDLVLLADGEETMVRFEKALSTEKGKEPFRWVLRPQWPAHLAFRLTRETGSLEFSAAWRCDGMPNELVWRIDSLPSLEEPRCGRWDEGEFHLPRDPELVFGWRLSPEEGRFLGEILEGLCGGPVPLPVEMKEVCSLSQLMGPSVAVMGAPAALLGFPVPGVFVQSRRKSGEDGIERFWRLRLAGAGISPSEVAGFPRGGTVTFPLTLTAVADEGLALWGIVDGGLLPPRRPLTAFFPGLAGEERLWAVVDLPRLSERLQTPEALGRLLSRFGRLPLPFRLIQTLREFAPLGRLVVVLPRLDSGWVSWTQPSTSIE